MKALRALLAFTFLAGCTTPAQMTLAASSAGPGGMYECTRTGDGNGRRDADRFVTLRRERAGVLLLELDGRPDQTLQTVQGTSGQLFANQLFAWRKGSNSGVLTDVERIATYSCQRVADAAPMGAAGEK